MHHHLGEYVCFFSKHHAQALKLKRISFQFLECKPDAGVFVFPFPVSATQRVLQSGMVAGYVRGSLRAPVAAPPGKNKRKKQTTGRVGRLLLETAVLHVFDQRNVS